jgi:hypothetical protein
MKNEMDSACSMHGRDKKYIQNFGHVSWIKDHLEDLEIDLKVILRWILQN